MARIAKNWKTKCAAGKHGINMTDKKTPYRELIERKLALRQPELELDLSKANLQEVFIHQVDNVLSRLVWDYRMTMDKRLNVMFVVQTGKVAMEHQIAAMEQALSERFDVWREPDGQWSVEARGVSDGVCCVKLEVD